MSENPLRSGLVTVCTTCGKRITTIEWTGSDDERSWSWTHAGPADHEPAPGPSDLADATRLCDICASLDPDWAFVTRKVIGMVQTTGEDTFEHREDGHWSVCTACKRLVVERDLDRLVHRGMISIRRFLEDDPAAVTIAKSEMRDLYQALFLAEPGEPEKIAS